jgi:hypothetical protein
LNEAYARDPRVKWNAALAYHFPGSSGKPDDLLDFTPAQFDHLLETCESIQEARNR